MERENGREDRNCSARERGIKRKGEKRQCANILPNIMQRNFDFRNQKSLIHSMPVIEFFRTRVRVAILNICCSCSWFD